jgi:hypothetical protein
VFWSAEAAPEGLDSLLPPWAQQLSLVSLLTIIIFAFLRGWVITRAQNERDIASERKISDIWQANAQQSMELNREFANAFAPVLEGNEAILRAVEAVQTRLVAQEDEMRRLRERGRGPAR